jgi:hypothetical protein
MLFLGLGLPARAGETVDVKLVLAVDTSGSINGEEYALQMNGIAWAFRQADVIAAATNGPHRSIAVNLMTWGDPDEQKFDTGFHIIRNGADAEAFAKLAETDYQRQGGGTGLGTAVAYGLTLLRNSPITARRQVIDVSGDGHESWELREPRFKLADAQVLRAAMGVTVNGLAILNEEPDLAHYYRVNVAGGPESFVITVANYKEYAEGIHRKLLMELQSPLVMLTP